MMLRRLGLIHKNQKGLTLIELLIAFAISSAIAGVIIMSIFQVINGSARSSNHMTAIEQVRSAGYWVSHDTQMADNVIPTNPTGFPLTLGWTELYSSGDVHTVTYTLVDNSNLQRSHFINGTSSETTFVARYIDTTLKDGEPQTNCEFIDTDGDDVDDTLIFKVTATVGDGSQESSESREYKIVPRPGS